MQVHLDVVVTQRTKYSEVIIIGYGKGSRSELSHSGKKEQSVYIY